MAASELRVTGEGAESRIDAVSDDAELRNDFLSYVADRRYSSASVRAYAFDLLHFLRWLEAEELCLDDADALVRYLAACRRPRRPVERGNVVPLRGGRNPDVASLIQSYLLAERPETSSHALFVVMKGPHRGQPLTGQRHL